MIELKRIQTKNDIPTPGDPRNPRGARTGDRAGRQAAAVIELKRIQTKNDIPTPGDPRNPTRYMKASKTRSLVMVGGLIFITDGEDQEIIPVAACDFVTPIRRVDPKTGKMIPPPKPPEEKPTDGSEPTEEPPKAA